MVTVGKCKQCRCNRMAMLLSNPGFQVIPSGVITKAVMQAAALRLVTGFCRSSTSVAGAGLAATGWSALCVAAVSPRL